MLAFICENFFYFPSYTHHVCCLPSSGLMNNRWWQYSNNRRRSNDRLMFHAAARSLYECWEVSRCLSGASSNNSTPSASSATFISINPSQLHLFLFFLPAPHCHLPPAPHIFMIIIMERYKLVGVWPVFHSAVVLLDSSALTCCCKGSRFSTSDSWIATNLMAASTSM